MEKECPLETILVLEDDPAVMRFFCTILNPYRLVQATTVEEALQKFSQCRRTLSLLIADVILPTGSGLDVALTVRGALPELPIILTSGYPESMWTESDARYRHQIGADSVHILQKPFSPATLLRLVLDLIQSPRYLAAAS